MKYEAIICKLNGTHEQTNHIYRRTNYYSCVGSGIAGGKKGVGVVWKGTGDNNFV